MIAGSVEQSTVGEEDRYTVSSGDDKREKPAATALRSAAGLVS
jgi:hypothetical protein